MRTDARFRCIVEVLKTPPGILSNPPAVSWSGAETRLAGQRSLTVQGQVQMIEVRSHDDDDVPKSVPAFRKDRLGRENTSEIAQDRFDRRSFGAAGYCV